MTRPARRDVLAIVGCLAFGGSLPLAGLWGPAEGVVAVSIATGVHPAEARAVICACVPMVCRLCTKGSI